MKRREERGFRVLRLASRLACNSLLTEDSSVYSGRGQFVGTDRAFSRSSCGWGPLRSRTVLDWARGGGAGVDEERDAAGKLVEDGGGCRAWGDAAAVGAGGGEGADASGEGAQKWDARAGGRRRCRRRR